MKIPDINLLLYALNSDSVHHAKAKHWLEQALSAGETVGFAWVVVLGFIRLSTSARIFTRPLTPDEALAVVEGWLARPSAQYLQPGLEHWLILKSLLATAGTAANLTTDAHLAALAIEHGAVLCSADRDFARFNRLHWSNPLA